MHQAFDALLDLDETAVVAMLVTLPNRRCGRIAPGNGFPRIRTELLHAERHAVLVAVETQDLDLDLVADGDDLGRVLDPLPGHVRDVQQAVDAAEVHEGAVVREVLDDALDDRAFLERREQRLALGAVLGLDDGAAGYDDVVPPPVQLMTLNSEFLASR